MTEQVAFNSLNSVRSEEVEYDCVIAVYDSHASAEVDVRALKQSGFQMNHLSIVGKDYASEAGVVGYYSAGGRMKALAKTGAFWGELWRTHSESALFVIPGIGPLFAAGPLVGWVVGVLEESSFFGDMSAVGAGLCRIGIPKGSVASYERQIKGGKFIVIAHGPRSQVEMSETLLSDAAHYRGRMDEMCG